MEKYIEVKGIDHLTRATHHTQNQGKIECRLMKNEVKILGLLYTRSINI